MLKRLRWVLLVLGILTLIFLYFAFPPSFYLPHKRPVLILPIDPKYDSLCGIMPMGEKIYHPNAPSGHPGIDFGFSAVTENIPYIAAMDGIISKVHIYDNPEKIAEKMKPLSKKMADVFITDGSYQVVYSEMDGDLLPTTIRVGAKIKQGDFVGYGNFADKGIGEGTRNEMIHWEFGSTSPIIDRFCPLTYFTEESRTRLENIWARTDTPNMKARYPEICNGDYNGKVER